MLRWQKGRASTTDIAARAASPQDSPPPRTGFFLPDLPSASQNCFKHLLHGEPCANPQRIPLVLPTSATSSTALPAASSHPHARNPPSPRPAAQQCPRHNSPVLNELPRMLLGQMLCQPRGCRAVSAHSLLILWSSCSPVARSPSLGELENSRNSPSVTFPT